MNNWTSTRYILNFCMLSLTVHYLFMLEQQPADSDFADEVAVLGMEVRQLRTLLRCNKLLDERRSR